MNFSVIALVDLVDANHELNTVDHATFKDIVSCFIFRVVLSILKISYCYPIYYLQEYRGRVTDLTIGSLHPCNNANHTY